MTENGKVDSADALTKTPLRVFAHGGGVQSTAALVLSAQGKIDFPIHLFCNVGDDSEHPATLAYVHEVSIPFAREHGIEFHELHRTMRDGSTETLLGRIHRSKKSLPIPVRLTNGAPARRSCTADFKIRVLLSWEKKHGATSDNPATVGIGISVDEIQRAGRGEEEGAERRVYPLLELGLRRTDCFDIITEAGLPIPPKSSCYFCPFHRPQFWREMRRDEPELFEKAAQIEDLLMARNLELGHGPVHLTDSGVPIREAISEAQETLFDQSPLEFESCDEGVCGV